MVIIDTNKLEANDKHAGALIGFKTRKGEQVNVRVASSFISPEQAELNLKELGKDNIDQIAAKGRKVWNDVLGRIEVEDDDIDHLRTFYSCLYRSVLFPRSFYEIDAKGDIVHYSPYNGEVLPGLYVYRYRFLGYVPLSFPVPEPDVSVYEHEDAGRIGKYLQRKRLPAGMGKSGTQRLYGWQQFRFCSCRCLPERI